ncbi:MAG: aldehyde dehydrogenase [Lachnospiraceae bacterium]|nr:aldehyde dehydrogenase [Lachnospiraceae bacterium]
MDTMQIQTLIDRQRAYFLSGQTMPVETRIENLKKLKQLIRDNEHQIMEALEQDLGKSRFESYMCEIGIVLDELTYMIGHTKKLAKDRRVPTPLAQFASRSYVKPSPKGVVLVMSPWNYPFMLSIDPLVDALAAGNTVILKPSAYSPATSTLLYELLRGSFPEELIAVITGGREENQALLSAKFDHIFFTGSKNVGRLVMEQASRHLTSVTLELGGKSPCIVEADANLKLAARRIVFGKYLNCGQTCVAPDYILCHESVRESFIEEVKKQIRKQYGREPLRSSKYGKMINQRHFERVRGLIDPEKVVVGGECNEQTQQIAPTVMDHVDWTDPVMQEEIFGPVMPILTYSSLSDVVSRIRSMEHPLAMYIFTADTKKADQVMAVCGFGGGCINDTIIHLATHEMGFGGFGESGMGSYHGKTGFDTFSHLKSIVDKKTWIDLPMRYQPYRRLYGKLIRMFLK